jgi:TRAP-type C4-dicarboxylate transport system permease small subunit
LKAILSAAAHCLDRVVFHIEEKVTAFSIIFMAIILIANVILRQFNSSLASAEELSQFLMFFVTFLGTSYAARSGMHIRMSMLSDALKGKARKILVIAVSLLTALVMLYVAYLAARYVMKVAGFKRVSPILQAPVQYVWWAMPVGLFLTSLQYFMAFIRNLISPGAWISYHVPYEQEPETMIAFEEGIAQEDERDALADIRAEKEKEKERQP